MEVPRAKMILDTRTIPKVRGNIETQIQLTYVKPVREGDVDLTPRVIG
jgi:hypothetical protein